MNPMEGSCKLAAMTLKAGESENVFKIHTNTIRAIYYTLDKIRLKNTFPEENECEKRQSYVNL